MSFRSAAFAATSAFAVLAGAQAPPPAASASVRKSAKVPLVLLPVTVLDRNGEPIRGLVADNFRLQDGEHSVMIESVGVEKRPPEPSEGSIPALPRKIVLAFDVSGDLENAKRAAAAFVRERMEPGDSAAIVTVGDGSRVTLAHGFLEDREDLAGQIRSVAPATGPGKRDSSAETTEPSAGGQARDAGSPATRAKSLGASLEELARALAAVPGPKQVVLFSPGEPGAGSARLAFRRAQCEVDSILVGRIAPAGSPLSGTPDADALVKAGVASLGTLSRSTGGALLQSGNDLEERLGRMLRAGNVVYVIAFAPVATGHPGRLHSVRVRVNKRGSRVVCRRGYLEPGS